MILAVKLYESVEEKPEGIPDKWPAFVREFPDNIVDPALNPEEWIQMTEEEYHNYRALHQETYNSWASSQNAAEAIYLNVQKILRNAKAFGTHLMEEYAIKNILAGKTPTEIQAIMIKCANIKALLESGSLYTARQAILNLAPDSVTPQEDIDYFSQKIGDYLGL